MREQFDALHNIHFRNHELMRELQQRHLLELNKLRKEQITKQHEVELSNQKEYTERSQHDLRLRHAAEAKQVPKDAKVIGQNFTTVK